MQSELILGELPQPGKWRYVSHDDDKHDKDDLLFLW